MVATGICHTDMVARDFIMGSPDFPVILGHEGSGIIVKVGQDVHHLKEGDHVVLTYGFCGECEICRTLAGLAPVGELAIIGVATKPLALETNIFLTKGYKIRFVNQGDSVSAEFIPKLIKMYQQGQFPFDRLGKKYAFEDINLAVEDSEKGRTIKAVLMIRDYNS
jgi:Zn-dependent alcohol dehydrogenase